MQETAKIEYRPHPLADIFPLMSGEEFVSLKADIKAHGLREAIWTYGGMILDGRNRFKACQEVGVKPFFREYDGQDPAAFVVSLNLKRRHLNESQRGMVAAKLANMTKSDAGRLGADSLHGLATANLQLPKTTSTEAADLLNVSPRTVATAKKVQNEGSEELIRAVEAADVSVSTAAVLVELPKEAQAEVVAQGPDQMKETAKEIKRAHVANNSGDNEWYTPKEYIDAAKDVLGVFDLDPASNPAANDVVGAVQFFTAEDDGLKHSWAGKVWMNPPYASALIGQFAEKLASHAETGDVTEAVVLVNNATETAWFSRLSQVATALCFPRGRVKFWAPGKPLAAPLQGQAILYIGGNPSGFIERFASFGVVAEVRK